VAGRLAARVEQRAARAILIDENRQLLLVKRTKADLLPYWTAPGGGVEDTDTSVEAALHRELAEELGAEITNVSQVFLFSTESESGVAVQHFFAARLISLDESARTGPEFTQLARGAYELDRIDLRGACVATIDLKPVELKDFIRANQDALLAEVGLTD
jgi:ADP-ribose pyrophosphatase YjhB (NUDIX family)